MYITVSRLFAVVRNLQFQDKVAFLRSRSCEYFVGWLHLSSTSSEYTDEIASAVTQESHWRDAYEPIKKARELLAIRSLLLQRHWNIAPLLVKVSFRNRSN